MIKLICIKRCANKGWESPDCIENEIYEIDPDKNDNVYYHQIHNKNGARIGYYERDCFITLAEWRDKQIDSILND